VVIVGVVMSALATAARYPVDDAHEARTKMAANNPTRSAVLRGVVTLTEATFRAGALVDVNPSRRAKPLGIA
jgi:hypothetical protein